LIDVGECVSKPLIDHLRPALVGQNRKLELRIWMPETCRSEALQYAPDSRDS
jgi:hypothetical protein